MTGITDEHVEWAMVDRLRLMLKDPPHQSFNVTQTFSLFSSILCWVMNRIRIKTSDIVSDDDKRARRLLKRLGGAQINTKPWDVHVAPFERIERIGETTLRVPAPQGFASHTAERFLINLRDATAHGDARILKPFNVGASLAGFTFSCAEFRDRKQSWNGEITLLEADMRRVGTELAKLYCDAIRHSGPRRRDSRFGNDAALVKEVA